MTTDWKAALTKWQEGSQNRQLLDSIAPKDKTCKQIVC